MSTAPPTISALPTPPDPNDRSTFNARAYPWSVAQQTLASEVGAVATNVYHNALAAADSASAANVSGGQATTKAGEASASASTASTKASEASASASTASSAASTASSAAGTATTAAGTATTKAAEASVSAAQAQVFATQQLKASSTTSLTPGAGSKTFAVEAGRSFVAGMYLVATSRGAPANKMSGTVVSYDGSTGALVITVDALAGAAARADWVIGVAASPSGQATPYADAPANTAAVAFGRYRLTASLDLTLPPAPADGDWVDVVNTSGTTTARVLRNGQNINGLAEDLTLDKQWVALRFVFRTGYGWIIT